MRHADAGMVRLADGPEFETGKSAFQKRCKLGWRHGTASPVYMSADYYVVKFQNKPQPTIR